MRYNEGIAPIRTWDEFKLTLPDNIPENDLKVFENRFKSINDAQERRSRAYEIVKQAQREGVSTDAYIDSFTNGNRISVLAPSAMTDLNMFYTPDNLKKYVRDFLSTAAPMTIGYETSK